MLQVFPSLSFSLLLHLLFAVGTELEKTDGRDEDEEQHGLGLRGAARVGILPVERVENVQREHFGLFDRAAVGQDGIGLAAREGEVLVLSLIHI